MRRWGPELSQDVILWILPTIRLGYAQDKFLIFIFGPSNCIQVSVTIRNLAFPARSGHIAALNTKKEQAKRFSKDRITTTSSRIGTEIIKELVCQYPKLLMENRRLKYVVLYTSGNTTSYAKHPQACSLAFLGPA